MNGQTNNNEPMRPYFSGLNASSNGDGDGNPTPPVSLNDKGIGFSNEPVFSSWSPSMIPTPGPIAENIPEQETPIPVTEGSYASPVSSSVSIPPSQTVISSMTNPVVSPVATPSVFPATPFSQAVPSPAVFSTPEVVPVTPPAMPLSAVTTSVSSPVTPDPLVSSQYTFSMPSPVQAPAPNPIPTPVAPVAPVAPFIPTTVSDVAVTSSPIFSASTSSPASVPAPTPIAPMTIPYDVDSVTPSSPSVAPQTQTTIASQIDLSPAVTAYSAPSMPSSPAFSTSTPASSPAPVNMYPSMPTQAPIPVAPSAPLSTNIPPEAGPISPPSFNQSYVATPPSPTYSPPSISPIPSSMTSQASSITQFSAGDQSSVPPPPKITQYEIKTLTSDSAALKASGGLEAPSQTFIPAGAEGEEIFNPAAVAPVKKNKSKIIFIIFGVIILLAAIGALGFFFVKPLFLTPSTTPIPAEIVVTVSDVDIPPVELSPASLFLSPANFSKTINIDNIELATFRNTFRSPEGIEVQDENITELTITRDGNNILFSEFLTTILPDKNAEAIKATFEEKFTLFITRDGENDLPGFIVKARPETTPEALSAFSTALEASPNLKNFYTINPGTMSAFKGGTVQDNSIRYAPFAAGYAFNYGWFEDTLGADYLVVASSYKGMVRAVELAGF